MRGYLGLGTGRRKASGLPALRSRGRSPGEPRRLGFTVQTVGKEKAAEREAYRSVDDASLNVQERILQTCWKLPETSAKTTKSRY